MDINSDIGEHLTGGYDREIMSLVTSVNISCGVHAGSHDLTEYTIRLAKDAGLVIGAHPGMPGAFGRSEAPVTIESAVDEITRQLITFSALAEEAGATVSFVKPHGALYNQAETDSEFANAVVHAIKLSIPNAAVVGLAGGKLIRAAARHKLRAVAEIFADRAYNSDGTLRPRSLPGAVIESPDEAAQRTVRAVVEHVVTAYDGTEIQTYFDTICVHGDTPNALSSVALLRRSLIKAGIEVAGAL